MGMGDRRMSMLRAYAECARNRHARIPTDTSMANGPAEISIRLMDVASMRRGHIARLIRCHVDADILLYTDGDFS